MFDSICDLLEERGYLAGEETTPGGRLLARIWSESDLVVAECLRAGVWDGLEPAELAAVVSTMVYEPDVRRTRPTGCRAIRSRRHLPPRYGSGLPWPTSEQAARTAADPGAGGRIRRGRCTAGRAANHCVARLDAAAQRGSELPPGDFIRWCKQVVDLLDQIAAAPLPAGPVAPVGPAARTAARAIRRGVVAQSLLA